MQLAQWDDASSSGLMLMLGLILVLPAFLNKAPWEKFDFSTFSPSYLDQYFGTIKRILVFFMYLSSSSLRLGEHSNVDMQM